MCNIQHACISAEIKAIHCRWVCPVKASVWRMGFLGRTKVESKGTCVQYLEAASRLFGGQFGLGATTK